MRNFVVLSFVCSLHSFFLSCSLCDERIIIILLEPTLDNLQTFSEHRVLLLYRMASSQPKAGFEFIRHSFAQIRNEKDAV